MAVPGRDPTATREVVVFFVSIFIAGLVAIVWSVTTIAATFFGRPLDTAVHGIMFAVVTAVLGTAGLASWAGRKNGNGKNGA